MAGTMTSVQLFVAFASMDNLVPLAYWQQAMQMTLYLQTSNQSPSRLDRRQ